MTVLEAQDRIGGRLKTDARLGLPLDLGASWIHGVQGNPISGLTRAIGARMASTTYDSTTTFDHVEGEIAAISPQRRSRMDSLQRSLQALRMGLLNKLYLKVDTDFWSEDSPTDV